METYRMKTIIDGNLWTTVFFDSAEETEAYIDSEVKFFEAKGYTLHSIDDNGNAILSREEFGKKSFVKIETNEI